MSQILIVEPDFLLARIYTQTLESEGHKVTTAADAQEGIIAADKKIPDLVILELQIAGHNGVEFLYEFRSYPEWQDVPILIHSLVPPAEIGDNEVLWHQIGIADYLYKPQTNLGQLIKAVDENLAAVVKK